MARIRKIIRTVGVGLTAEQSGFLDEFCQANGLSMSGYLRTLLAERMGGIMRAITYPPVPGRMLEVEETVTRRRKVKIGFQELASEEVLSELKQRFRDKSFGLHAVPDLPSGGE